MEESIYNLVPKEYVVPEKEPMYRSKFDPKAPLSGSTFGCLGNTRPVGAGMLTKKEGALFGPTTKNGSTTEFLKKGTRKSIPSPTSNTFRYEDPVKKEALPKRSEQPIYGIKSDKNYITSNAVEAILQVPKSTDKAELNYLKKEDYGKVPVYLSQVQEEIRRENEMIESYVKRQETSYAQEPEGYAVLTEGERLELIEALKAKWDAVNANYQKITHLVVLDSLGQIRRKEGMEATLKQLEMDIKRLESLGMQAKTYK